MREATTTTAREVIGKTYLSITDIQTVLGMTREPARILFQKVKAREKEKLGEYDVWPNMIQKENLLKAIHITQENLMKDIQLRETHENKKAPTKTSANPMKNIIEQILTQKQKRGKKQNDRGNL